MPIIRIELIEGRSVEQKRKMAEKITDIVSETAEVPKDVVDVIFYDIKKEDFASSGKLFIDKT